MHRTVYMRIAGLSLWLVASSAGAANFVVGTTADGSDATPGDGVCATASGDCTLRAAVQETNALPGGDQIDVPAGAYVTTTPHLPITDDLTIVGAGEAATIIEPSGGFSWLFRIAGLITVEISGVTIRSFDSSGFVPGAAIAVEQADLYLGDSTLTGNAVGAGDQGGALFVDLAARAFLTGVTITDNDAGVGGGIAVVNDSSLTLVASTVDGNRAARGAGVSADAGAVATITDSTISRNDATDFGGGLLTDDSMIAIANSTISGNSAVSHGGGIADTDGSTIDLLNVTMANNAAPFGAEIYRSLETLQLTAEGTIVNGTCAIANLATVTSLGGNLERSLTCGFFMATDQFNTDALLGALAANGGPTLTHLPLAGSPAIDKGSNVNCPAADQRGLPRSDGLCDAGAVEIQPASPCGTLPPGGASAGASAVMFVLMAGAIGLVRRGRR